MTLRVHGDKRIRRRVNVVQLNDYRDAKLLLMEDFHNMCGYCGKNSETMRERFHIDHFVPKRIAPERKEDYTNLVLACPKCNLSKSGKWPTKDKNISNDGNVGFVDPATEEYDCHLERDEQGYIRGITLLGENICKNFNFDVRRTDLYWKIQSLYEIQDELENMSRQLDEDELRYYMECNIFLKKYIKEAFEKGE